MLRIKRNIGFVAGLTALIFLSSCSVSHVTSAYKENSSLTPNRIEVHLTPGDIGYMGETSIDIDYKVYLGVIRIIEHINGEPYEIRKIDRVMLTGPMGLNLSPMLERASYKVTDNFPEADYYVVNRTRRISQNLFMGSFIREEATVKAYKIGYRK